MRARQTPNDLAFKSPTRAICAALALAAAATASSAGAQVYADEGAPYVDEVIITGPVGPDGYPTRLSRTVSLSDLDLATREDQTLPRVRIRDTARDLCRALGEDASGPSPLLGPSCETRAVRNARPQVRLAIEQAYDRARYASLDSPYAPRPYPY